MKSLRYQDLTPRVIGISKKTKNFKGIPQRQGMKETKLKKVSKNQNI